jgi:hypothetical protein
MLKGVIFSLHDVLAKQGAIRDALFGEILKLLRYLKGRGVARLASRSPVDECASRDLLVSARSLALKRRRRADSHEQQCEERG